MGWDGPPVSSQPACLPACQAIQAASHPFSPHFGFGWKITHPSLPPSVASSFPIQSNSNRLISPRPSAVRRTRLVSRLGREPTHAAAAAATTYLSIPLARLILSLSLCSSRPVSVVGQKSVWASCVLISRYIGAIISQRQRPTDRPTDPFSGRPRSCFLCSFILEKGKSEQHSRRPRWMDGWMVRLPLSLQPSLSLCFSFMDKIGEKSSPIAIVPSSSPPLSPSPPRGAGMDVAVFILETV